MATVEERIDAVENKLATLQQIVDERLPRSDGKEKSGWQAIVGTFTGDALYDEAMRQGREWRDSQKDVEIVEDVP